jgi:hypothetical protein
VLTAALHRRAFAVSYSTDKTTSTFFGRPPQLSIRYCTCRPPFDLTDDELIAPSELRELAISRLDSEGWNTSGAIHRQTWARMKIALSVILEEVLELSLGAASSDIDQSQKAQYVRLSCLDILAYPCSEPSSTKLKQLGIVSPIS